MIIWFLQVVLDISGVCFVEQTFVFTQWERVQYFNNKIICDLVEAKPVGVIALMVKIATSPQNKKDTNIAVGHTEMFVVPTDWVVASSVVRFCFARMRNV